MNRITPPAAAGDTPAYDLSELKRHVAEESAHGRALVADIGDNPVGTVVLDPDIPCVHLVWHGYATDLQIRYVHEAMLELLRNHGISKILCDNTLLPTFGQDVVAWITANWMPRAMSAGLRAAAATEPRSAFSSAPLHQLVEASSASWTVGFFDDVGKARDWLRACA